MTTYRVLRKRYSEVANNLVLVAEEINADTFHIDDGVLVFIRFNDDHTVAIAAIPPTLWFDVEEAGRSEAVVTKPLIVQ